MSQMCTYCGTSVDGGFAAQQLFKALGRVICTGCLGRGLDWLMRSAK